MPSGRSGPSADRNDVFTAQLMGLLVDGRVDLRIENDLSDAGPVSEVDKNKPSMVTPGIHPSGQVHGSADIPGGRNPPVV